MLSAARANRRYFRQAYRTGEHGWEVKGSSPYAAAFLKRLSRCVRHGRLLDVGCGEGRHAVAAAKLGFRVTGIDYEPLAVRRARRFAPAEGARRIVFRRADVLRLPLAEASFDVVLDYGCLHHQRKSDWPAYRAGILRVLKPEGYYVLSVFSPEFPFFRGGRRPWHLAKGAYRRCFTRTDILGLFAGDFELLELKEERRGFWHVLMRRRLRA
jgi:SAM-dependent methyltransferase